MSLSKSLRDSGQSRHRKRYLKSKDPISIQNGIHLKYFLTDLALIHIYLDKEILID